MYRKSKTESMRLSGVFDLFSEPTEDLYCQYPHSDEVDRAHEEIKEKKSRLFSFRKKSASESKACEKQMNKLFRQNSKFEKSDTETYKDQQSQIIDDDYNQVILRRSNKIYVANVTGNHESSAVELQSNTNQNRMRKERKEDDDKRRAFFHDNPQLSHDIFRQQFSSKGNISPTGSKVHQEGRKSKIFKFPSKNKEKSEMTEVKHMTFEGLVESSNNRNAIGAEERSLKVRSLHSTLSQMDQGISPDNPLEKAMKEVELRYGNATDKRNRLGMYRNESTMLVKDISGWNNFQKLTKEPNYETRNRSQGFQTLADMKQQNKNEDRNKRNFSHGAFSPIEDKPKYIHHFVELFTRVLSLIITSVIYIIRFVLFLPRKLLIYLTAIVFFLRDLFSLTFKKIKQGSWITIQQTAYLEDTELKPKNKANSDNFQDISSGMNVIDNDSLDQDHKSKGMADIRKSKDSTSKRKHKWWKFLRQSSKEEKHNSDKFNEATHDIAKVQKEFIVSDLTWKVDKNNICDQCENERLPQRSSTEKEIQCMYDNQQNVSIEEVKFSQHSVYKQIIQLLITTTLFIPSKLLELLKFLVTHTYTATSEYEKNSTDETDQTTSSREDSRLTSCDAEQSKMNPVLKIFGKTSKKKTKDTQDMNSLIIENEDPSIPNSGKEYSDEITQASKPCSANVPVYERFFGFMYEWTDMIDSIIFYCIFVSFIIIQYIFLLLIKILSLPFIMVAVIIRAFFNTLMLLFHGIGKIFKGFVNLTGLIILLVLLLPERIFLLLKAFTCHIIMICQSCYLSAARKLNLECLPNSETDFSEVNECRSEKGNGRRGHHGILRIMNLFKTKKNQQTEGQVPAEISLLCDSNKGNNMSRFQNIVGNGYKEPKPVVHISSLNQYMRKCLVFIKQLIFKILHIILSIPLMIFIGFGSFFNYLGFLCTKASSSIQNFIDSHIKTNIGLTERETADKSKMKVFQSICNREKILKTESELCSVIKDEDLKSKNMMNLEEQDKQETSMGNPTLIPCTSESEKPNNQELQRDVAGPKPFMLLLLKIFLLLQAIFIRTLWYKISCALSYLCKITLLWIVYLTPSCLIKWTMILVVRFTPGVKNRQVILKILQETPAKITKSISLEYIKRVSISVMMKHAQMSLKDSTFKETLNMIKMVLKFTKKSTKSFFMTISKYFKQMAKRLQIADKKKSTQKPNVFKRLLSGQDKEIKPEKGP